ncbi:hypothetical protein DXG01_002668 [Tephrocybe rancida]|nr:hypothetical protein DXG01_002668 [Tephrocybe rancida]
MYNKKWLKEAQNALAKAALKSREIEKTHKEWKQEKSGMEFKQSANLKYPELRQAREEVQGAEKTQVAAGLYRPKATTYVPLYTTDAYRQVVEHWYEVTKGVLSEKEGYGFKEIRGGGNVGFWPLFYADVRGTTERRELKTNGLESKIDLTFAMVGAFEFDINAGFWDDFNIKTVFPSFVQARRRASLVPWLLV